MIKPLTALVAVLMAVSPLPASANYEDIWADLQASLFGQVSIAAEDGVVTLDAPVRAEDAALVPITIHLPTATAARVKKLTLVVDKNPVPVAAVFEIGPAAGDGERLISTRIRVNRYTFIRAVAETDDGQLHQAVKFVKASGGCSAPFGKDYETALEGLGKTKVKSMPASVAGTHEAQLMIRHPSFTGMQLDPVTRVTPPARFVEDLRVTTGGALIFAMQGGISISEDPNIRFTYQPKADAPVDVTGRDTAGTEFSGSLSGPNS